MKKNQIPNTPRQTLEKNAAPNANREKGAGAERAMLRNIRFWSLIVMVVLPLVTDIGLRCLKVYVDTFVAVYYPTTAVTVLQWLLYYLMVILTVIYQFGGFGILGYSIMRYNVKKSLCPILLSVFSITLHYGAGIAETVYMQGINAIKNNLAYLSLYWTLNYFLALFTTLCVIFLCAMLRISFIRHGKLLVQISEESPKARRQNVLRRLYLWITALMFLFNFFPAIMNMTAEIRSVGGPETIWDWITLLQPFVEIILLHALGYLILLRIGSALTKKNEHLLTEQED